MRIRVSFLLRTSFKLNQLTNRAASLVCLMENKEGEGKEANGKWSAGSSVLHSALESNAARLALLA